MIVGGDFEIDKNVCRACSVAKTLEARRLAQNALFTGCCGDNPKFKSPEPLTERTAFPRVLGMLLNVRAEFDDITRSCVTVSLVSAILQILHKDTSDSVWRLNPIF